MKFTALHKACKIGHAEIAKLILAAKADVNTQNMVGWIFKYVEYFSF